MLTGNPNSIDSASPVILSMGRPYADGGGWRFDVETENGNSFVEKATQELIESFWIRLSYNCRDFALQDHLNDPWVCSLLFKYDRVIYAHCQDVGVIQDFMGQ